MKIEIEYQDLSKTRKATIESEEITSFDEGDGSYTYVSLKNGRAYRCIKLYEEFKTLVMYDSIKHGE